MRHLGNREPSFVTWRAYLQIIKPPVYSRRLALARTEQTDMPGPRSPDSIALCQRAKYLLVVEDGSTEARLAETYMIRGIYAGELPEMVLQNCLDFFHKPEFICLTGMAGAGPRRHPFDRSAV